MGAEDIYDSVEDSFVALLQDVKSNCENACEEEVLFALLEACLQDVFSLEESD